MSRWIGSVRGATIASVQAFSLSRYRVVPDPREAEFFGATDLAVPIIDGTPLFAIVGDRYPGVAVGLVAPPSRHWFGNVRYGEDGRAVVLDCICGHAACCGVFGRIAVEGDAVVWSDFCARGVPELPRGLHFEFDRPTYETAIIGICELHPVE